MNRLIRMTLRACALVTTVAVLVSACPALAAELNVTVVDQAGEPTPFRAWVDVAGTRHFEPDEPSTATPYGNDRSFSAVGSFTFSDLPAGAATIHVEKGKEYLPIDRVVELSDDGPAELRLTIRRWIDMPGERWYSADLHIHLGFDNPRVLAQLALADDIHLSPVFTYWLRGTERAWAAAWPTDDAGLVRTVDPTHILTYANIEIERINSRSAPGGSVGASFLYNLTRPVTAERFGEHFPTDADLILAARRTSPAMVVDTDKPSWAETVVGMPLGAYDTVQLSHNHYHRLGTIPGGYGMIGPIAADESNAHLGDGLFHRTNALYYRFLMCGIRLAASGGSAIGVMPVPNGYSRTYAQVRGEFTPDSYWAAVKAGRTFATSGPMLTMTAGNQPLGSTIEVASGSGGGPPPQINVEVRLRSIDRIEALQLVLNGGVVHSIDLRDREPDPAIDVNFTLSVEPRRSGFIAARALYRAPDGLLRQAHTSPIYIRVDGRPTASAPDARYMIEWIDRLTAIANEPGRYPTDADRDGVLATYGRARAEYERIIQTARDEWGDL